MSGLSMRTWADTDNGSEGALGGGDVFGLESEGGVGFKTNFG